MGCISYRLCSYCCCSGSCSSWRYYIWNRDDINYIEDENPETLNFYSYAKNNPVSFIDPNGNAALEAIIVISYEIPVVGEVTLAITAIVVLSYGAYELGSWVGEKANTYFSKKDKTNNKDKAPVKDGTPQSNTAQNDEFDYAAKGLDKAQRRRLHDNITGRNLSKDEIIEERNDMFPKNSHPNPKYRW